MASPTLTPGLAERLERSGQGHLVRHLEGLAVTEAAPLLATLEELDFELLDELRGLLAAPDDTSAPPALEPPPLFPLRRDATHLERARRATERGSALLREGRVGYVLVAGGQGSRLGFDGPKGLFTVGPVSGWSLFELFARKLQRVRRISGQPTPWYVMTSPSNDAETRAYFSEKAYFGLDPEDVFFFSQDMLPALDEEGRILLAERDRLFVAPNGHGGVLLGLRHSGALEDMRRRGVELLSYFQVDNPLARPADPLFLGLHATERAGMSTKVVAKRDAAEKVGVIGKIDGRMGCIEYSDLPEELRHARDPEGALRFRAGNTAAHTLSVDFLAQLTEGRLALPWHVAKKSIRCLDVGGTRTERTGFKFETFVFDALGETRASVTLEVERTEEFSPVKNKAGEDSPASARRDLCALHAGWVRARGLELPPPDAEGVHPVEIDPLLAETLEEFLALDDTRPEVHAHGHLYRAS